MTDTTTASPPVLARVLIVGSGIMSPANSVTVPFLAVFLHKELGLRPGMTGFIIGSSVFFSIPGSRPAPHGRPEQGEVHGRWREDSPAASPGRLQTLPPAEQKGEDHA